jgi:hypothetical protein
VDQGVAVSVGTAQGKAEVGHERRKRMKRGSDSAGRSPYNRTRRWLRQRKRWALRQRPRCRGRGQGSGGCCLKRSARPRHNWPMVQTGQLTGWPHMVLIFPS